METDSGLDDLCGMLLTGACLSDSVSRVTGSSHHNKRLYGEKSSQRISVFREAETNQISIRNHVRSSL